MEQQLLVHLKKEGSSEILKVAVNKSVNTCYQFDAL
jgi:hypothetical protein